jgi:hypothetical protein
MSGVGKREAALGEETGSVGHKGRCRFGSGENEDLGYLCGKGFWGQFFALCAHVVHPILIQNKPYMELLKWYITQHIKRSGISLGISKEVPRFDTCDNFYFLWNFNSFFGKQKVTTDS